MTFDRKAWMREYEKNPKRIAYCRGPKRRAATAKYESSEHGKASISKRRSSPEGKRMRALICATYRASRKGRLSRTFGDIKRRYGLTAEGFDALMVSQLGCCAVGWHQFKKGDKVSVDHDHVTGAVRGLLCHNHNVAIGYLGDSPDAALAAFHYLATAKLAKETPR